jgi:4-cresol dehydrogenase (hydroxylating)
MRLNESPAFDAVLERLRQVIGSDHVLTSRQEIERRSTCTIPWKRTCAAVVYPGTTEEVQAVIRIAHEFSVAVWPFSKGNNWGYGSTLASHDGAIILILERLNRILEVSEELAYAVLEPGVTYRQLNQYLKDHKVRLWSDCTDGPPDGSVLGNALERGIGETSYGDHFGNLCGLEVILPNGDLVHTGGGLIRGFKTWHTHKWGAGPYLEGLFSQSNFGVVTKGGIWLMPEPEAFNSFSFELHRPEDFPHAIDALRRLALQNVIQSKVHMINDVVALSVITQYPKPLQKMGLSLSVETLAELRRRFGVAAWSFSAGLYGSREQVREGRRLIRRALGRYGRLTFISNRKVAIVSGLLSFLDRAKRYPVLSRFSTRLVRLITRRSREIIEVIPHLHQVLQGIPTEFFVRHAYFKSDHPKPERDVNPARDGCGLIWFAPMVPLTGRDVTKLLDAAKPLFEKQQFDFYVALLLMNPRSLVVLMAILYRKDNHEETERAQALYAQLGRLARSLGYQEYRSSVAGSEHLFDTAPEFRALCDTLKSALDPANILAPGRYGIGRSSVSVRPSVGNDHVKEAVR